MIDRIELVRKIPHEKLSKEEQKGMKKTGYTARAVIIHLDGLIEDVELIRALLLKHNNTDWTSEE